MTALSPGEDDPRLDPALHYVDPEPWSAEAPPPSKAATLTARQLMGRKFRRHRLAWISLRILAALYLLALFAEFFSVYPHRQTHPGRNLAPPDAVRIWHEGSLHRPFTYARTMTRDLEMMQRIYAEDRSQPVPLGFFCRGEPYLWLGLIEARARLICPGEGATLHWLGTDRRGRDVWARMLQGARISLTIGLAGVAVSLVLGVALGGLAGYFGGWTDAAIQRVIEVLRSLPELPLWMALAAAIPASWPPLWTLFALTLILGLLDWTGLARAVRGRLLALREEDFTLNARLAGARPGRIIRVHLVPNLASHLIANATLSIPAMILAETTLSFLGLGVQAPLVSWGVLLTDAQRIDVLVLHPWLLWPAVPVILTVLAFNFVGDGLRDAADPFR